MTTSNERALKTIDQMVERQERESREALQRALDRGGMPTEAEILDVEAKVNAVHDAVEELNIRLRGIANTLETNAELPFSVTSEHVGLIAGFAYTLESDVEELRTEVAEFATFAGELELVRRQQIHDAQRDVAV